MSHLVRAAVLASTMTILASCDRPTRPPDPGSAAAADPVAASAPNPSTNTVYMCPMDKDIRSNGPGKCPRCGMTLVTSIPDPVEYHLDLRVSPSPAAGQPVRLSFEVSDPWKGNPVTKFETIHEKLFHAFIVGPDLEFFRHGHPDWNGAAFTYDVTLPTPGIYRVLGDFYPEAATPQLLTQTVIVPGEAPPAVTLGRDYSAKQSENLNVGLQTIPEQPMAGFEARLRFMLNPATGLQRYLGVWAHLLAVSDDLIDMMHTHPSLADGSAELEFKIIFPRSRVYRVWVQFQREGVVNTAHFDVPVGIAVGTPPGNP